MSIANVHKIFPFFHSYNIVFFLSRIFVFKDGNRRPPPPPYKPSPPPLDSTFHRDKNLSTTENAQYDLKPESETPQESATIKKDASHQGTLISNDNTKNRTSNPSSDKDGVEATTDDSAIRNTTKKPEPEESTKKHIIHKHHTPSKETKINDEETLILGVPTDYITPTHITHSESSKTETSSSSQVKVTKSSKNDEKTSATVKGEKPTEKTTSIISKTTTKTFSTSTLNIETSSSVQVIESRPTKVILKPTLISTESNADTKSGINLEPSSASDIEYTDLISSVSTPTDGLPSSYSKSTVTIEKSAIHPTTSKNIGTSHKAI